MNSGREATDNPVPKHVCISKFFSEERIRRAEALLLSIIFLLCAGFSFLQIVYGQTLSLSSARTSKAVLFDFAGIFGKGDKVRLKQKMQMLQDEYGITPLMITIPYNDTEKLVKSGLYDLVFGNRTICEGWNCTLVFSEPEIWESFSDWKWDVIYGEKAGPTVPRRLEDLFLNSIRSSLTGCHCTLGNAIEKGINEVIQQQPQRINDQRIASLWQAVFFLICPVALFAPQAENTPNDLNPKKRITKASKKTSAA